MSFNKNYLIHIRFFMLKFTFVIYSFPGSLPALHLLSFNVVNGRGLLLKILQLYGSSLPVRLLNHLLCATARPGMHLAICFAISVAMLHPTHPLLRHVNIN